MGGADYERFANLDFEGFRRLATDDSLGPYERIGFPNAYREGYEPAIFDDIRSKLPVLSERGKRIVDIGPGCSELPAMVRQLCEEQDNELYLIDSPEMLDHHPVGPRVHKLPGQFPKLPEALEQLGGRADAVIAYSVLHYVHPQESVHAFLTAALDLLAHGGALLVGDLPNWSMRTRFMRSPAGVAFHQQYTQDSSLPDIPPEPPSERLTDAVLLGLVAHARESGFHAWLVPQAAGLPMANRREDLLVIRP